MRLLSHIFYRNACIYRSATRWDLPPYRITIWLIDEILIFVYFIVELILGFVTVTWHEKTGGLEFASTIILVLQTNRLAKCASLPLSALLSRSYHSFQLSIEKNDNLPTDVTEETDPVLNAIKKYKNDPSILKIKSYFKYLTVFSFKYLNVEDVKREINNINSKKETPNGDIPVKIFKWNYDIIVPVLIECYKASKIQHSLMSWGMLIYLLYIRKKAVMISQIIGQLASAYFIKAIWAYFIWANKLPCWGYALGISGRVSKRIQLSTFKIEKNAR